MYTLEERVFIVEHCFREGDKYNQTVKDLFRKRFPKKLLPHRDSVRDMIKRFRTTGSVIDKHRSGRPKKKKENAVPAVEKKEQSLGAESKTATLSQKDIRDSEPVSVEQLCQQLPSQSATSNSEPEQQLATALQTISKDAKQAHLQQTFETDF